ncbi:MAG: hypothetical protein JSS00_13485 [Proteobacteria bacterium]|nr:hypothetical protein [Pseudomonadota bacterium]
MRRDLADSMMSRLRELEALANDLSALSEQLEGDERTGVRRSLGQIKATAAALQAEIGRQHSDLNPDKAP